MATLQQLPSGKWRARYLDHEGKRRSVTRKTLAQAKSAASRAETEADDVRSGRKAAPVAVFPTLAEFSDEFMRTHVKANNKPSERVAKERMFRTKIIPAMGAKRLDAIGLREIEAFKAALVESKLSPKSINNVLACLRKVLNYAHEIGTLPSAPKVKALRLPPPEIHFLDFEEYARLLAAVAGDKELLAEVLLAGDAGLRAGELRALERGDLDLKAGRVTVRHNDYRGEVGSPKSGRDRHLKMTGRLLDALKAIRHLRGPLVLCKPDGVAWTEKDQALRIVAAGVRAGLPLAIAERDRTRLRRRIWYLRHKRVELSPEERAEIERYQDSKAARFGAHVLRHTFASHLVMRGAPLKSVQELMGHATIQMTMRYAHLAPAHADQAIALLEGPAAVDTTWTRTPTA